MPICEIHFPKNLLEKQEIDKITDRLTNVLLQAEGFEINQISRSLCLINMIPSDSIFIGGKISEHAKIVIKIHVFEDAYSDTVKQELIKEITKIFIEENKLSREQDGNNVWCIIFPIGNNNFGAGGRIATLEDTKKFISLMSEKIKQ
jgi:phenylpyruvate tautomerase PptA (4-oxalocrotonate tautomerase family)